MARIDDINARRAARSQQQQQAAGQSVAERQKEWLEQQRGTQPQQSAAAPTLPAGVADDPQPITYANSGIAPTVTSGQAYRQGALRDMTEDEFRRAQEGMNASDKEYWAAQYRQHPDSVYTILRNQLASDETPEEKRKRERSEQLGRVFQGLGNVIGSAANLYFASQGAYPVDYATPVRYEDERLQRIKEKRDELQAKEDALLAAARQSDIEHARDLATAREKAAADKAKGDADREADLLKARWDIEAEKAKADADREVDKAKQAEQRRHNLATERLAADKEKKKNQPEVAYSTKYGDVIFDNPENKRAATLAVLEIMRNGAPEDEREKIDEMLYGVTSGDVDSYNKAEVYVSQNLNADGEAMRYLYDLARQYGRINKNERQRKAIKDMLGTDDRYGAYRVDATSPAPENFDQYKRQ